MNQLDNLKPFIDQNREAFDDLKAPEEVWRKIEGDLEERNVYSLKRIGLFGLAILVLAILTYLFSGLSNKEDYEQDEIEYAAIPDFLETQEYFISEVNAQRNLLKMIHEDATLEKDLSLLDQIESELRIELKEAQGAYKAEVLNALIQNYQTKLSLLQKVLAEVKESDSSKSNYYEM